VLAVNSRSRRPCGGGRADPSGPQKPVVDCGPRDWPSHCGSTSPQRVGAPDEAAPARHWV